ncbi:Uncharacterized protein FKW44_016963 [Caligus rogercresseyi]|uniref:Uncharacterized protein n=1 Tax=Caligus rogercresseyi TaxID=217165 RepID=A0A7T8K2H4_CALRO|nr:Uncharacterized protein FKW44_016963 [Caligus rogercresseyi]
MPRRLLSPDLRDIEHESPRIIEEIRVLLGVKAGNKGPPRGVRGHKRILAHCGTSFS